MREILFRGKTLTGRWVDGSYYKQEEFYGSKEDAAVIITSKESLTYDQSLDYAIVLPETVGQYTGLLDKDGKKVFEGDIVKVYDNFDYVGETLYVGKVQWDDTFLNWELKTSEKTVWQLKNIPSVLYYEVIGNVFDNPEMLEVKQCY